MQSNPATQKLPQLKGGRYDIPAAPPKRLSWKARIENADISQSVHIVYAAFFALSALRSRLRLAASGPLSVSMAQSHQVKELE
jgi:hypothetical protein